MTERIINIISHSVASLEPSIHQAHQQCNLHAHSLGHYAAYIQTSKQASPLQQSFTLAIVQVPHGSLGKGSGTPKNLARSHVLVAKVLTNSDAHGRIILPRVSVEANLTFLMGYRQVTAVVVVTAMTIKKHRLLGIRL